MFHYHVATGLPDDKPTFSLQQSHQFARFHKGNKFITSNEANLIGKDSDQEISGRFKKPLDEQERKCRLRLRLEPIEIGRFVGAAAELLVESLQDVHVQHFALEIGTEQRFAEDGLIKLLQFVHRKSPGKQV